MKKILEDNKIYFEILAAFTLSVMAVIISFLSLRMDSRQLKLNELNYQPIIQISAERLKDTKLMQYNDEIVRIENIGFHLRNYSSQMYTFINIQGEYKKSIKEYIKINKYVPIVGYYQIESKNARTIGEIEIFYGQNSGLISGKIYDEFVKLSKNIDKFNLHSNVIRVLKLEYKNYQGEMFEKYFNITTLYGGVEITDESPLIAEIKNWKSEEVVDFNDELTAQTLLDKILPQ